MWLPKSYSQVCGEVAAGPETLLDYINVVWLQLLQPRGVVQCLGNHLLRSADTFQLYEHQRAVRGNCKKVQAPALPSLLPDGRSAITPTTGCEAVRRSYSPEAARRDACQWVPLPAQGRWSRRRGKWASTSSQQSTAKTLHRVLDAVTRRAGDHLKRPPPSSATIEGLFCPCTNGATASFLALLPSRIPASVISMQQPYQSAVRPHFSPLGGGQCYIGPYLPAGTFWRHVAAFPGNEFRRYNSSYPPLRPKPTSSAIQNSSKDRLFCSIISP